MKKINPLLYTLPCVLFLAFMIESCKMEGLATAWHLVPNDAPSDVFHLSIGQDGRGYAVGGKTWYSGYILLTTNGGETWQILQEDTKAILDLNRNSSGTWVTTGVDGHVWEKRDTGIWSFRRLPEWRINRAIVPLNDGSVILGGGSGFQFGHLFRADSTDQVSHLRETDNLINDLAVCANQRLIAAAYGAVFYSDDQGESWDYLDLTGDNFMAIEMIDGLTGYMVGYGGTILKTTDAWHSWSTIRNGDALTTADTPFRGLAFKDEYTGVLVGDAGTVWLTRDGGTTWVNLLGISASIDLTTAAFYGSTLLVGGTGGHLFSTTLP
ncbi:MAG: hypothetical protein IPJ06_06950 [Saprospiraceae bacterium]|nr:hypothetical protein [Saprospiraceae bacterium]